MEPPKFDETTIPSIPSVSLNANAVDAFVRWVAATPVSKAHLVRDAISVARGDDEVLGALVARLFELPVKDFGRHQILLSIIGELRRPEAVEPLMRFVNLPNTSVLHAPRNDPGSGSYKTSFDGSDALQARAVEMLTYLQTPEALKAVLTLASEHSSRAVRLAALNAFTFNHDDNPEAIERARAAARPDEAKFVGLARRSRDFDPVEFDAKVLAFYKRYPEENPPVPNFIGRRIHGFSPLPRSKEPRH
jgi:hypothetical protein